MEAQSSPFSSGYPVQQNSREAKDMKLSNIPLHTTRKPQTKPWRKPTASTQPASTRVYMVDRMDFRDVVQKLTGAPQFQSQPQQHRKRTAVPPLELAETTLSSGRHNTASPELIPIVSNSVFRDMSWDLMTESVDSRAHGNTDDIMQQSILGMNTPNMHNWVPLLSPRSLLSHLQ